MARGMLTDEVKALSKELFGYEITVKEFRLLPYIQYCIMNGESIACNKSNADEWAILMKWQEEGRLDSPSSNLKVSSNFYDIMCKILKIGYCSDVISD